MVKSLSPGDPNIPRVITNFNSVSTTLQLNGAIIGNDKVIQQPGVGVALDFRTQTSFANDSQLISGSIQSVSTNIYDNTETFDLHFLTCHKKSNNSFGIPDTRLIISPGNNDQDNENKLILINPYASDADLDRKSKIQFRGKQVNNTVTGTAQSGGSTTITLASGF